MMLIILIKLKYDEEHNVSTIFIPDENTSCTSYTDGRGGTVMAWPDQHKAKTRERIIKAAAGAFRRRGIGQTNIADIMREAGLTHGGFYAHFESKDALVAEALTQSLEEVEIALSRSSKDDALNEDRLVAILSAYLSPGHVAHPERGCPLAAIGPELMRCDERVKRTLADGIRRRLKEIYDLISSKTPAADRRQLAVGALACMVGGLIVARGMSESEGLEFLKDCRSFLRNALGTSARLGRRAANGYSQIPKG
jgi:TetR/AcrR family transcriptional regulator, transcriptional repressor for nem operon